MDRIYLDVCCLNRPFDDQGQERIRLESEAVLLILARAGAGQLEWAISEVVEEEIERTPDPVRRSRVRSLIGGAGIFVTLRDEEFARGEELAKLGFQAFDALHLAIAEAVSAVVFLTTDDRLLRVARRVAAELRVRVANPLEWLREATNP